MTDLGPGWARFRCAVCGAVAGTVVTTKTAEDLPDDLAIVTARLRLGPDGIVLVGFIGDSGFKPDPATARAAEAAVDRGDAGALHAISFEWAPFYCSDCTAVYCKDHWTFEVRYDEDPSYWYDSTYGTCPQGHRHLVDD